MKIDSKGQITTGAFTPHTGFQHWWKQYPYEDYDGDALGYDDLFSVAKAFGVSVDQVQLLLDYGCSEEEIEDMLYDPTLLRDITNELLCAY